MLVTTDAIVISSLKYNDNDLIVKCFTRDFGIKSYLIKGAFKSKKKKLSVAYFQLFSILSLEANHKDTRAIQYIREVKRKNNLAAVHQDVKKTSIVIFLCEVLSNILTEEEAHTELYNFIESSIITLDKSVKISNFHLLFLVRLTSFLGFYPNLDNSRLNYFNLAEGEFQDKETNAYCITGRTLTCFKSLLGTNFDVTKTLNLTHEEKRELLNMILVYFRLHLHGFKQPKSLSVLNQVFS